MFLLNFIFNCFFPTFCANCGIILDNNEKSSHMCKDCLSRIVIERNPKEMGEISVYSPFEYTDFSATLIKRLKYDFDVSVATPLGRFLIAHLRISGFDKLIRPETVIIPIPLHHSRLQQRGFNQAEILANIIGKELDLPVINILQRHRNTHPQSTLPNDIERITNIKDSFSVKKGPIIPKDVILIDDIWTTGSTMKEVEKVLRNNGVKKIHFVVCAIAKHN